MGSVVNDSHYETAEGVVWLLTVALVALAAGFVIGAVDTAKRCGEPPPPRHVAALMEAKP